MLWKLVLLQFTQLIYNDGKDNDNNSDENVDDPDDQFSDDNTTGTLKDKYGTRVRGVARSVSDRRWVGDGFFARPKPSHS